MPAVPATVPPRPETPPSAPKVSTPYTTPLLPRTGGEQTFTLLVLVGSGLMGLGLLAIRRRALLPVESKA